MKIRNLTFNKNKNTNSTEKLPNKEINFKKYPTSLYISTKKYISNSKKKYENYLNLDYIKELKHNLNSYNYVEMRNKNKLKEQYLKIFK